ncbi:MAG: hypothetical protein U5Q44_01995 [Dehalococcoidia bacterium]|nr:hypothetical protein [Dehalococcoidia bacterium]
MRRQHLAVPQDEDAAATYCSLIRKNGYLAAAMSASEAERAVRAYDPWPGAYVLYRGERMVIRRAHVEQCDIAAAGDFVASRQLPAIALDGLLVLEEVQRGGGKRIAGDAFVNGERGKLEEADGLR